MNTSVLITNHLTENLPYLLNAVKGHAGNHYPVTIISSAETAPVVPGFEVLHRPDLNNATKKVEHFMSKTTAKYTLWQSDDVIVSPDLVRTMTHTAENVPYPFIQTPLSNNEEGSRFVGYAANWLNLKDKSIDEVPNVEFSGMSGVPILIPVEWFAFYCAFIPKEIYDRVLLDENLENRYNDVDFCLRARAIGVMSCINANAFAFHYGTRTLKTTVTPEQYAEADRYWANKIKSGAV